jgi:hypothetical protein
VTVRRRAVLTGLAGALGALSGCNAAEERTDPIAETETPVPVPTDRRTPRSAPPAALSALGVDDAAELGERHWRSLSAAPHGLARAAAVRDEEGLIRHLRMTIRARTDATAHHIVFEFEDSERYPSESIAPYLEVWIDDATYQRFGREDPEYTVVTGTEPALYAPSVRTTERYRIAHLFEAFSSAAVDPTPEGFEVTAEGLREGYDVTPRRLHLLVEPRGGRLEAVLEGAPLSVGEYRLSVRAALSGRPVDVESSVDYERLEDPPEPPSWIETAIEEGT